MAQTLDGNKWNQDAAHTAAQQHGGNSFSSSWQVSREWEEGECQNMNFMRFEIHTTVIVKLQVYGAATPYRLLNSYRRFGEA